MSGAAQSSRSKKARSSGNLCNSNAGSLPTIPEHDPLAGTACLTSGRGVQLQPPSPSALLAALALFDDDGSDDDGAAAALPLPTGATWPLLSIVTPAGLQAHVVEPDLAPAVDSRDPRRLTSSKRRTEE